MDDANATFKASKTFGHSVPGRYIKSGLNPATLCIFFTSLNLPLMFTQKPVPLLCTHSPQCHSVHLQKDCTEKSTDITAPALPSTVSTHCPCLCYGVQTVLVLTVTMQRRYCPGVSGILTKLNLNLPITSGSIQFKGCP